MQKKQECVYDVQSSIFMMLIFVKLVKWVYWKPTLLIMMWLLRNSFDEKWGEREVKQNFCGVFFDIFGPLFLARVRVQLRKIRSGREMGLHDLGINNWVIWLQWDLRVGVEGRVLENVNWNLGNFDFFVFFAFLS